VALHPESYLNSLSAVLVDACENSSCPLIEKFEPVAKGANGATHFKLSLKGGGTFSLKVSTRIGNGTKQEYLAAFAARAIGLSATGRCALIQVPPDVPVLANREAALLEWTDGAIAVGELPTVSAARLTARVAIQLGGWVWLCCWLGIGDRHLGNWIWSEATESVGGIDNEEWAMGGQKADHLRGPCAQILGGNIDATRAAAIQAGAAAAHDAFDREKVRIEAEFLRVGIAIPPAPPDAKQMTEDLTGLTLP